jgi:hypothetical protein
VLWRDVSDGATLRRDVPAHGGGGTAAAAVIGARPELERSAFLRLISSDPLQRDVKTAIGGQ